MAAIEHRGRNAITNFDISTYADTIKQFQEKMQPENPESSPEVQVDEQQGHKQQLQQEKLVAELKVSDVETAVTTESQPTVMMGTADEHEHPWNMCLDSVFNSLPDPDIPFEKPTELLDFFVDTGFEDNIDFFFGAPFDINELNQEAVVGSTALGGELIDTFETRKMEKPEATPSPSQSSSSTMTSAGCNILSAL